MLRPLTLHARPVTEALGHLRGTCPHYPVKASSWNLIVARARCCVPNNARRLRDRLTPNSNEVSWLWFLRPKTRPGPDYLDFV